jgi:hypothetical protein
MTNGANYKRGKLHHSPWHSDIRTPNQLNKTELEKSRIARLIKLLMCKSFIEHIVIGLKLADLFGFELIEVAKR